MVTYMLGLGVVFLWGVILFKIFNISTHKEQTMLHSQLKKQLYIKLVDHQEDNFLLYLNYRDPFFGNGTNLIEDIKNVRLMLAAVEVAKIPEINWNEFSFKGYINNKNTGQKLAIIAVKGNVVMLAVGHQQNGIKLLEIIGDSIKIRYKKTAKYIRIK